MAPVEQPRRRATWADLEQLPGDRRVELIHGEIVERALPTWEHGDAQTSLAGFLKRYFGREPGGRWPGGWWLASEIDVEYATHEIFRHDLVGWRRERGLERPRGRPIRTRPDWVCEILSTNRKRDLVDKLNTLQAAEVPFYWLVDPEEKTLTVLRLEKAYVVALAAASGQAVRAEPFDAIELRLGSLFGDEDPDE
jgi:Uma2 family endonuclease